MGLYRVIAPDMGIPEEVIDDEFLEETKDDVRVSSWKAAKRQGIARQEQDTPSTTLTQQLCYCAQQ